MNEVLDVALDVWVGGGIMFAAVSFIATIVFSMESRNGYGRTTRRDNARLALKSGLVFVFSWAWPVIAVIIGTRSLRKTFEIAELEGPIDKWRQRQAKKIAALEAERSVNQARIKQLERELDIPRREVA